MKLPGEDGGLKMEDCKVIPIGNPSSILHPPSSPNDGHRCLRIDDVEPASRRIGGAGHRFNTLVIEEWGGSGGTHASTDDRLARIELLVGWVKDMREDKGMLVRCGCGQLTRRTPCGRCEFSGPSKTRDGVPPDQVRLCECGPALSHTNVIDPLKLDATLPPVAGGTAAGGPGKPVAARPLGDEPPTLP